MPERTEFKSLPVELNDQEKLVRAKELAESAVAIATKEEEIKAFRAEMKVELDELKKTHDDLVQIVKYGRENRSVECTWVPDYGRRVWTLYRNDQPGSAPVNVRPMKEHERQLDLVPSSKIDPDTGEYIDDDIPS